MENSNVLVTGSQGFIGRHLCTTLMDAGINLAIGEENKDSPDVTNLNELKSLKGIGAIVHLAGKASVTKSIENQYQTYFTNVLGTLNLLELARLREIRSFIFVSPYVYGQPEYLPVDEKHPVKPFSPYHESKLLAEKMRRLLATKQHQCCHIAYVLRLWSRIQSLLLYSLYHPANQSR